MTRTRAGRIERMMASFMSATLWRGWAGRAGKARLCPAEEAVQRRLAGTLRILPRPRGKADARLGDARPRGRDAVCRHGAAAARMQQGMVLAGAGQEALAIGDGFQPRHAAPAGVADGGEVGHRLDMVDDRRPCGARLWLGYRGAPCHQYGTSGNECGSHSGVPSRGDLDGRQAGISAFLASVETSSPPTWSAGRRICAEL